MSSSNSVQDLEERLDIPTLGHLLYHPVVPLPLPYPL